MEIFPDCTRSDIVKSLRKNNGDLDVCIQSLLEHCESTQNKRETSLVEKKAHTSHDQKKDVSRVKVDATLKDTILSKYVSMCVCVCVCVDSYFPTKQKL